MIRVLPVCAALLALAGFCRADDPPEPTETVIRLSVQPAAEPRPALLYQLLPNLVEMNPGNPIPGYLKCFMAQNNFWHDKESVEHREKWQTLPLKDLPHDLRIGAGYGTGDKPLRIADEAARLEHPDWQTLLPLRREGVNLTLPELQPLRTLAAALRVRMRFEIADKRFGDAVNTAKTLFALARHLGEHPSLIGDLVGVAVAMITLETLGEMIGQPGCPNLYWALTDLPTPLVELRKGLQGERVWLNAAFGSIPGRVPLSEHQSKQLLSVAQLLSDAQEDKVKKRDTMAWLTERGNDAARLDAARKRLIATGFPPGEHLQKLPPWQVILIDEVVSFEIKRDNQMKVMMLPYWQIEALAAAPPGKDDPDDSLFGGLVKSFFKVRRGQARLEQRVALLRCVEALRLHAADHDGKLPAKLADVKVPLPIDPISGRPFIYTLDQGTATLRGTPPAGQEKTAGFNIRYEIKIAQ